MVVGNIQVIFNLHVTNQETEEEIINEYFGSIDELNRYLHDNSNKEPLISEIVVDVCSIENDSEIILNYSFYLSSMGYIDEDELEQIQNDINGSFCVGKTLLTPNLTTSNSIVEKKPKAKNLNNYKYVCPHCWESLSECTCSSYPYFTIQVDVGIHQTLKVLNLKGYETRASCESHIEDNASTIHIVFGKDYKFDNTPEGYTYSSDGVLKFLYHKQLSLSELINLKEEKLKQLYEWSRTLPKLK